MSRISAVHAVFTYHFVLMLEDIPSYVGDITVSHEA